MESGATASIDGMITGESETTGDGKVKMVVTYEDESGAVFTAEKELTLLVTAPMTDDMMMNESEMVEQEKALPDYSGDCRSNYHRSDCCRCNCEEKKREKEKSRRGGNFRG